MDNRQQIEITVHEGYEVEHLVSLAVHPETGERYAMHHPGDQVTTTGRELAAALRGVADFLDAEADSLDELASTDGLPEGWS